MSAHTPGPWEIDIYGDVIANGEDIARDILGKDLAEAKANARLIAAAPDLLEALLAMEQEKWDYMIRNNLGDPSKEATNKLARAAIRKATGAQP